MKKITFLREQLEKFLPNAREVIQFTQLFTNSNEAIDRINENINAVFQAESKANQALSLIEDLKNTIESLALSTSPEEQINELKDAVDLLLLASHREEEIQDMLDDLAALEELVEYLKGLIEMLTFKTSEEDFQSLLDDLAVSNKQSFDSQEQKESEFFAQKIYNEFDPSESQIITNSWMFKINNGKYFLATDDTTLAASKHLFGYANHATFAPTSVLSRDLYADGSNQCGSYWDFNDDTSANCVIATGGNTNGSFSDSATLTIGGYTERTMTHTVIKSLFTPYANLAAINAAIATPANDMFVMVNGQGLARYNGAWVLASDDTTAIT